MQKYLSLFLLSCFCAVAMAQDMTPVGGDMPSICLDEEEEKERFVNESCKVDADCYNQLYNSSMCIGGLCTCTEDYIAQTHITSFGESRVICTFLPWGNQSCTSKCQKPLVCAPASAKAVSDGMAPAGGKICQCLPPFIEQDGGCFMECKPEEILFGTECKKRCAANEIFSSDGSCKKMANLGEACEEKCQCSAPFAECQNKVCTCSFGFTATNGTCVTTAYSCPTGDPIRTNGAIVECKIVKSKDAKKKTVALRSVEPYAPSDLSDTCAEDQFCVTTSGSYFMEGSSGFCCQMPKLTCPIGQPHPTGSCSNWVTPGAAPSPSDPPTCPMETHTCKGVAFGEGYATAVCCPDQCSYNQVFANGRCLPRRDYGDQCDSNEQCSFAGGNSGACISGKCACATGYTLQPGPWKYCAMTCKDGETSTPDGKCVAGLKLGDKCDSMTPSDGPWARSDNQCPPNSHCSSKTSTCICDCGQVKLDSDSCGPLPQCALPYANATASTVKSSSSFDPASVAFCKVPGEAGTPPVAAAVATCPNGQYCQSYLPDLGLCCPKPAAPTCMDGTPAKNPKPCDQSAPTSGCADTEYCHMYLNSAASNDPNSNVCCPMSN